MRVLKTKLIGAAFLFALVTYACSKKKNTEAEPENINRTALLTNLADNIIIPSYANFKTKFDIMLNKSEAFTANPDKTSLLAFRTAWTDAYVEWQKVEMFDFGPAQKETLRNFFNIYPASESGIAANIASGNANLETPASYSQQGFPALDYLINGLASNDDDIVAFYSTAPDKANRINYLKNITARMNLLFTKVNDEWKTSYRNVFINKTALDAGSSLSVLVNSYVLNYERFIRAGKFGIPSGVMQNGAILPNNVEAFYKKDISLALAKAAQQASADFFIGKSVLTGVEGPSLKTYLAGLDAKDSKTGSSLAQIIIDQFKTTDQKLALLSGNLYNEVNTNNQAMINVYNEMQKTVRLLKVDMTSAMSITITYTDNDGD